MLFWLIAGNLWIDHQLYQHLICRAKGQQEVFCVKKLLAETEKLTPERHIKNIKTIHRQDVWKGSLIWKIHGLSIPIKQILRLP